MGNFLNLVYDKWEEGKELPEPNGVKHYLDTEKQIDSAYVLASNQIVQFNVKLINRKIEDVITFPDEIFFYCIWYRHNLTHRFFSDGNLPINQYVIDLVKQNKNLHLIFMNECETEPKCSIEYLDKIAKNLEINPKQLWIINNNSRLEEFKEYFKSDINVHTTRSMSTALKYYNNIKFTTIKEPGSFFLCHNRTPKNHRYGILCLLKKYNILDDVDWSLINGWYYYNKDNYINDFMQIFSEQYMEELTSEINYFISLDIYKSKYEQSYKDFDDRINQNIFSEKKTYENAYFNIVTETNFVTEDIHITEKSFKPFLYYHFPLILSSYQHIKNFKKTYDLDFFDDVINHDYDDEKNDKKRLIKFTEEIRRIYNNKEFFIEFYKKNKDRFIENHDKLRSFVNQYDSDFFNSLKNYGK